MQAWLIQEFSITAGAMLSVLTHYLYFYVMVSASLKPWQDSPKLKSFSKLCEVFARSGQDKVSARSGVGHDFYVGLSTSELRRSAFTVPQHLACPGT